MKSRNFWHYLVIVALALLPLAGCSSGGGSAGSVVSTEKGVSLTVEGTVDGGTGAGKTVAKTVAKTAIALDTVAVYNAQDGLQLGSATIAANGSFSGLTFTLPTTKTVLVFKATVAQGTFLSIVPIDLSTPPTGVPITGNNPITIVISQESTATAQMVSSLLGLTGDLGDAGMTLNSLTPAGTYAAAAQLVVDNGGQQLAYSGSGLALTGKFSSLALLPAQDANTLTGDQINTLALDGAVTRVSIPGNNPIISFQVTNKASGKGVRGLKTFAFAIVQLKPGVSGGPDEWLSYMVSDVTTSDATPVTFVGRPSTESSGGSLIDNGDGSYVYKMAKNIKATTTTSGLPTGVVYNDTTKLYTHRVAIQVRTAPVAGTTSNGAAISSFTNAANIVYDFVPASGAPVTGMLQREITTTAACNECHTKIGTSTPHGGRVDTRFCVVCHTKQRANGQYASTIDANGVISTVLALDRTTNKFTQSTSNYVVDGQALGNFVTMVHKVHMGSKLTLTGYNYAGVEFNPIVLPQDVTNCRKCHKGDNAGQLTAAPQGNNWQTRPSRQACGACHDNVNFATGVGHEGAGAGAIQASDALCGTCHAASSTDYAPGVVHRTINATPNNPNVADGLVNFFYEISSVTVDGSNQAVIKFRIQQAVAPATAKTNVAFTGIGYDKTGGTGAKTFSPLLTNFVGSPSFQLVYTQDGSPDYTNMGHTGKKAAQPISVSIANLADGTKGTLGTPDGSGYYTATITAAASNFPAGATIRAVGLQGYFTQANLGAPYAYTYATQDPASVASGGAARHAVSVQKAVTSDVVRRKVIDSEKCGNCHEWFEGHGGNRVKEVQVCIQCHVPNLSTSGKGADINLINFIKDQPVDTVITTVSPITSARYTTTGKVTQSAKDTMAALVAAVGSDPTKYPEDSNNMKDMIHGIHAGSSRAEPMKFVRDRGTSGVFYYDFGHIKFPGILKDCTMCHVPVTSTNPSYAGIPTGAQVSTIETSDGTAIDLTNNVVKIDAVRKSVPNASDKVTTPFTASCVSCHDSVAAKSHMKLNGGQIKVLRSAADPAAESCVVCHGPTGTANVVNSHK